MPWPSPEGNVDIPYRNSNASIHQNNQMSYKCSCHFEIWECQYYPWLVSWLFVIDWLMLTHRGFDSAWSHISSYTCGSPRRSVYATCTAGRPLSPTAREKKICIATEMSFCQNCRHWLHRQLSKLHMEQQLWVSMAFFYSGRDGPLHFSTMCCLTLMT